MVGIKGQFAKDDREYNGLEAFHTDLVDDPLTRRVVVGVIETSKIVRDMASGGVETPTVRFVQLEVLTGADAEQAQAMLNKRYRVRTGRDEDAQESLFGAVAGDAEAPWPGDVDYDTPEDAEASQDA